MDKGAGRFEELPTKEKALEQALAMGRTPETAGIFEKGEIIVLRGSRLQVEKFNRTHLILRLMPRAPVALDQP